MIRWKTGSMLLSLLIVALIDLSPPASSAEALVYPSAEAVQPLLVGTQAPGGILKTGGGASFDLAAALQAKPTVLVFYRGSW